ncbi:MAG: ROK family protein [Aigarchaeota archaeon]|nr:ROK family protein [Aigarchaeota archaeon]MDW8092854.1 ROK family protein [Nitrososphaerota archaeon]
MILAADIGGSKTRVGLFDRDLNLIRLRVVATPRDPTPDSIPETLIRTADEVSGEIKSEVTAFGVASMGPIDVKRGTIVKTPTVGAENVPLIERLKEWLEVEYFLANDCNAAAYAEWWSLRNDGVSSLVYITISTGIGGGAVVDDCLLLGKDGNAAEVGHIVLDHEGYMRCGCGGLGHWEAYCSGRNVVRFAKRLYDDGFISPMTRLAESIERDELSSERIFELQRAGDAGAVELLERVAVFNAAGISSVIATYDPHVIVMGGSVVLNNFDFFVSEVFPLIERYSVIERPEIVRPVHNDLSPLMGAAMIARHRLEKAIPRRV